VTKEAVEKWYKEDGVRDQYFDPNKTQVEEWRYYFYKGKILRITDPYGKNIIDGKNADFVLKDSQNNYKRLNSTIHSK